MISKNNIEDLVKDQSIFMQKWWLEAVCGEDNYWDFVTCEEKGVIISIWPYVVSKKNNSIMMPILTQRLGPVFYIDNSLSHQKRILIQYNAIKMMLDKLPKVKKIYHQLDCEIENWLPFYWTQFNQTTRYTYIIDPKNIDFIVSDFDSQRKKDLKKAQKMLNVVSSDDVSQFYDLNLKTFRRRGERIPYSLAQITNIDDACKLNEARKIMFAIDKEGQIHAGIYLVFDKNSVYYLMGGIDPEFNNSGGMTLLMFEGIKFASEQEKRFDFEGSMMEGVGNFFRSFGAQPSQYFAISRDFRKTSLLKKVIQKIIS